MSTSPAEGKGQEANWTHFGVMRRDDPNFPNRLEDVIRRANNRSAVDIVHTVFDDLRTFANPIDDVSLVVIKKF